MSVTLDVSRLSGWLNDDAYCRVGRRGGREVGGCGAAAAQAACTGRARLKAGGQGTRGAHREHVAHVRDARCVEAQQLVECFRFLCAESKKSLTQRVRCGWETGGLAMCSTRQGAGRTQLESGGRAWAVNTSNMLLMSLTPEVFQPEMSALNASKSLKS